MTEQQVILESRNVSAKAIINRQAPSRVSEISAGFLAASFNILGGPDGCGRNLLLRVLGLMEGCDEGEVFFQGCATNELSEEEKVTLRNQHFGFLFSAPFLLPSFSVIENVAMPLFKMSGSNPDEARVKTESLLHFVGLSGQVDWMVDQLSLFEQHRLSLARAMINEPDVLFVEDIDRDLKEDELSRFMEMLRQLVARFGTTVLLSASDTLTVDFPARIIQMNDGKIVADFIRMQGGGLKV